MKKDIECFNRFYVRKPRISTTQTKFNYCDTGSIYNEYVTIGEKYMKLYGERKLSEVSREIFTSNYCIFKCIYVLV